MADEADLRPGVALTEREHVLVGVLGDCYNAFCAIADDGPTRDADLAEVALYIHALQGMVLRQAAARIYPWQYRVLGGTLPRP